MKDSTIVVTGSGGFLGGWVMRASREIGPGVRVVGVDVRSGVVGVDETCDLCDAQAVVALVEKLRPDVVLHMAGGSMDADWRGLFEGFVLPMANVLEAVADKMPDCHVVVPSSASEYGDPVGGAVAITEDAPLRPTSPYAVAKSWQSTLAERYGRTGLHVVVGRVFNVIGPGVPERLFVGTVASQLARIQAGESEPILRVGDLKGKRDYLDVRDVATALLALAERGRSGTVYNVCSGASVPMSHVLDALVEASGIDVEVVQEPNRSGPGGVRDSLGSNERIREETGWEPGIDLRTSARDTLESFRRAGEST